MSNADIYPAKYFGASSTYDHWCKLSIADVHRLRRVDGFEGQNICFWLNHPIRFVYLVAVVVGINEISGRHDARQQLVTLTLDDGSGAGIEAKFARNKSDDPSNPLDTGVKDMTVSAGLGHFDILIDGVLLEVGMVVKAKGTLASFREVRQLDLKRLTIVNDTNDEAAAWKAAAEFKRDVLSRPWVLDDHKKRGIDDKLALDARESRHHALKQRQKRARHQSRRLDRERHREQRRQVEESEMNHGALFYFIFLLT